jgi:L,D-transpeptidase ErfK/SrfK
MRWLILSAALLAFASAAHAGGAYPYGPGKSVIGFVRTYAVPGDETLHELAREFDLGYNEITDANPALDPWVPGKGGEVVLPTAWVLPDATRRGVVINLAEMRLYHYLHSGDRDLVRSFPIGIATEGVTSPRGSFSIADKLVNPAWYVPRSVREEKPGLPGVVPPGEDNPLGEYAMRLAGTDYFIHGTNQPYGIGRRVSHGCIRLYPEDIRTLFFSVPEGTTVNLVYQPVKVGVRDGVVHVEVHDDYLGLLADPFIHAVAMLKEKNVLERVTLDVLLQAVEEKKGIPVPLHTTQHPDETSLEAASGRVPAYR